MSSSRFGTISEYNFHVNILASANTCLLKVGVRAQEVEESGDSLPFMLDLAMSLTVLGRFLRKGKEQHTDNNYDNGVYIIIIIKQ